MNNYFINGDYINADYFKNILLGSKQSAVIKTNNSVPYKELTYTELINNFKNIIKEKNINNFSPVIMMKKEHLLYLLILLYENKEKAEDILEKIFKASSYETREEILLSILNGDEDETHT